MIKLAINGFGRIGRPTFKLAMEDQNIEVVAVNDLTDNETLAHLLKYDTVYGTYDKEVEAGEDYLKIDGEEIKCLSERDPAKLPWKELGVDVVLECTGVFRTRDKVMPHLEAGAKKVILSAPPKDDKIKMFCMGCNLDELDNENDLIVSNASCTTNCLAPPALVLDREFGINKALMTTIHSYTSTQNLVDGPNKDLRRARAAAQNLIPTTTGAAIAVTEIFPKLKGKFDGMAIRVPTPCGSIVDLTAKLEKDVTIEEVNEAFIRSANGELKGILAVNDKPLVSSDFIKNSHSSIVDLDQTNVIGKDRKSVV